jgi:uncharacterized protein YndB with AHSA1/START domain
MPDTQTIELTESVAAPRDQVFHALVDAGELSRWWTTRAESDPRTGGRFAYVFEFEDAARDHTYDGEYDAIEPGRRVAFPWQAGVGPTSVTFLLDDEGDGTRLTLRHDGWPGDADEAVEMHRGGWTFFLGNLKTVYEDGVDRRAKAMGQKVAARAA